MGISVDSKNRLVYLDVARGIAMIAIVLGHLGQSNINKIVFTFHLSIFYFITGYFLNKKNGDLGLCQN